MAAKFSFFNVTFDLFNKKISWGATDAEILSVEVKKGCLIVEARNLDYDRNDYQHL